MAIDTGTTPAPARSRRALLTAALGGLGGLFASRLGAPTAAAAAAGDPLILGTGNSNPNSYGVFGSNDPAAGSGGAVRAAGNANHGLVASTASAARAAIKATNSAINGTVALFENTSGGTVSWTI